MAVVESTAMVHSRPDIRFLVTRNTAANSTAEVVAVKLRAKILVRRVSSRAELFMTCHSLNYGSCVITKSDNAGKFINSRWPGGLDNLGP